MTARRLVVGGVGAALALVAAVGASAVGCSTPLSTNPNLQSLDRPTDVAFACHGRMRVTNGANASPDQPTPVTAMPLDSCRARARAEAPPGQQDLTTPSIFARTFTWYAFVLQSVPGTVAVAQVRVVEGPDDLRGQIGPGDVFVNDATSLTPGKNSLSVGSLPVAIASDAAGCHMVTANAGSCDLSIIDVNVVVNGRSEPAVRRQEVLTAGGVPVRAKPAAMIGAEEERALGFECPAEPDGLMYIAYPDCHAVAAVRAGTGRIEATIRFADDGTALISDGELTCAAACDGEAVTDGARPVTLDVVDDPRTGNIRLAVGLDNRPVVTVVDLDPTWLPISLEQFDLEGDIGVFDVAISPQIAVGGVEPADSAGLDEAQFVYAVATDGSVRVVEVFDQDHECDTQADPRFLLDIADPTVFTCIPAAGLPGSRPRRAKADGPGIRIPGPAVPVSVAITRSAIEDSGSIDVSPTTLRGTFAWVGLSNGVVATVNVDDDNYPDLQLTAVDPFAAQLSLAMPHQPRDAFTNRVARTQTDQEAGGPPPEPLCLTNPISTVLGGPRSQDPPQRIVRTTGIAPAKAGQLPMLRQIDCTGDDGRAPVSEVQMNAPDIVRLETFPDWRGLEIDELWTFTWEGVLSADTPETAIDGPAVRSGQVVIEGGGIRIHDAAGPFCEVGVEDRDQVVLRGCDPSRGDAQCAPGHTCYVHPDSTQAAGTCLPREEVVDLAGACRDFLVSNRRFAVKRAFADTLELIERRRVLRTTPIDGCTSSEQCQQLATYDDELRSADHPASDDTEPSERTFACELDPSRPAVNGQPINRCVQTCEAHADCGAGGFCNGNRCIEAPVPPPECVVGLQRFEVQASDAFVVLGSITGYLHSMIADPATGRCVKDPDANPLLVGRIPLAAPACGVDAVSNITPNPCTIEVNHTEAVPVYAAGTCTQTGTEVRSRPAPAVRFRNPGMNLNLVDLTYPGDATCIGDRGGGLTGVPTTYPGYQFRFRQVAGFATVAPRVCNASGQCDVLRASYLSRLVVGPDRGMWVIDEGDVLTSQVNARGQIFRFNIDPFAPALVVR